MVHAKYNRMVSLKYLTFNLLLGYVPGNNLLGKFGIIYIETKEALEYATRETCTVFKLNNGIPCE